MSEAANEVVSGEVTEVSDESPTQGFSQIFPAEIKYQSPDGAIESIYIKQGTIAFSSANEQDGEPLVIQIVVPSVKNDIVIHRYTAPASN